MPTTRPTPAYRQVADDLRNALLQGRYPEGVALPTEAELVQQYGCSRQTIRRAFQELGALGMVTRVPGRGTFAASPDRRYLRQFGSVEDLMGLSSDTTMQVTDPLVQRIDVTAAGRLRSDSDTVAQVAFLRLHGEEPFCLTECSFPVQVGDRLDNIDELHVSGARSTITIIGALDTRLAKPIVEADQSITATAASQAQARLLGCAPGSPLLRIDRLYYDADGTTVELAVSYFTPEAYSYRVRLHRNA